MTRQDPSKATRSDPQGRHDQAAAPERANWLRLLVFLNAGVLACMAAFLVRGALWSPQPAAPAVLPEQLKATAVALEKRGLDAPAAAAWQSYVDAAPEDPERAEILYHVGELHVRAEQFDQAASAFVHAELAAGENKELAEKVGPRLIECLGGMGRFGEVSRELARRRESGAKKPDDRQVVATIGEIKITESDLDQMVEDHVDRMLAAQGVSDDRNRRQMALQQASRPNVRARLLHDLVQKELFLRRAHELKLDQDKGFLLAREQATQALLLGKLQNRELKLSPPTEADLEAFYQEHQADFRQPDKLDVLGIRVADEKAAAAVLEKITSAADFRKQAQRIRQSGFANGEMAFTRTLFLGQADPVLGNTDALFALSEGQWTKEPITRNVNTLLVLVETKTAARTPSFAEVKQYVRDRYLQRMKSLALDKLFRDLMAHYDVDIKLDAVPRQLPEFSDAGGMIAEPGSAAANPLTPPAKPVTPAAKPVTPPVKPVTPRIEPVTPPIKPVTPAAKPVPKPQQKPDNPLRDPDSPEGPPLRKAKPAAEHAPAAKTTAKPGAGRTAPEAPPGPNQAGQEPDKTTP